MTIRTLAFLLSNNSNDINNNLWLPLTRQTYRVDDPTQRTVVERHISSFFLSVLTDYAGQIPILVDPFNADMLVFLANVPLHAKLAN